MTFDIIYSGFNCFSILSHMSQDITFCKVKTDDRATSVSLHLLQTLLNETYFSPICKQGLGFSLTQEKHCERYFIIGLLWILLWNWRSKAFSIAIFHIFLLCFICIVLDLEILHLPYQIYGTSLWLNGQIWHIPRPWIFWIFCNFANKIPFEE